eukprot:1957683-Prymnesium_polylepis.1
MSPADFALRFGCLLGLVGGGRNDGEVRAACADMLQATAMGAGLEPQRVGQMGRSKVFLSRRALELLEEAKAGRERTAATAVQRAVRA